jgi:hypothetical protein
MRFSAFWFEAAFLLRPLAGNSPRRATYFLLLRQKKVGKEKATPLSVSLRFATGNLRCSEKAGVRRTRCTSFRSDSCGPYPAFSCAPRHSQRGLGSTRRGASLCGECACIGLGSFTQAERSEGPLGICGRAQRWPDPPLWLRRGAQRFADKGSQLSERNAVERVLRDPAKREHRRLPRSAAKGSQTVGRLFFGYFLLAKQKKVTRPPGRDPANSLKKE